MGKPKPKDQSAGGAPANTEPTSEPAVAPEPGYTKQQFLGAAKYAANKDVLNALLQDETNYTTEQVDQLLKEFLEMEAK